MTGFWQQTARTNNGNASLTVPAPAGGAAGGTIVRLRGLQLDAGGAGSLLAQVLDGSTVIWQQDLGNVQASLTALDLRTSPGNALVINFTGTNTTQPTSINAQGDYVPQGYPAFTA